MNKITRNSMIKYLPKNFATENIVNPKRIFDFNNEKIKKGTVIYLMTRDFRLNENFSLQFAVEKSTELKLPLKIICLKKKFDFKPKNEFFNTEIEVLKKNAENLNFDFEIFNNSENLIENYLKNFKISLLIKDFNPIEDKNFLKNCDFKIFEVDAHNIVPVRFVSKKQEYSAMPLRIKIYHCIYEFMSEFKVDYGLKTQVENQLQIFLDEKLKDYAQFKNNPCKNVTSNLSKYISNGFISTQKIALDILKFNVSDENKEAYLEELIIRKELSENFCLYAENFKDFSSIPLWAKETLEFHKNDFRNYLYIKKEFEKAKTHDKLWNASQLELLKTGKIHSYMRMYWAKKILEWSKSPQEALEIAIYLNDKYAFDSPSPNGYEGILWSIGGLHDRAFKQRQITGKIRPMTFSGAKSKFDVINYIEKFS